MKYGLPYSVLYHAYCRVVQFVTHFGLFTRESRINMFLRAVVGGSPEIPSTSDGRSQLSAQPWWSGLL